MKPGPTVLLLVLSLTTITAGTVAWQQYQRAERLEVQIATARDVTPPPTRMPIVAADETEEGMVENEVVAESETPNSAPVESIRQPDRPRGERNDPAQRLNAMMENPDFAAAWQAQQKARLDERYAALFRKLNLNPAQIDQLKSLLVDRQASRMDVMAAAREEGFSGRENRDELRVLMEQSQAEVDASIRNLLGSSAYNEFQRYEQTAPQRAMVGQIETRLSYSSAPLTAAQSEALVGILAETGARANRGGAQPNLVTARPSGTVLATNAGGGTMITDQSIARAQGVLSPAQVDALRQLQEEQQAQQRVSEMMRRQFQRDRPAPPAAPGS